MGSTLGKAARRSVKNWNIENRAHKVIEKQKDKPAIAPKYKNVKENSRLTELDKELSSIAIDKNENLHEMLHGIVVEPDKLREITGVKPGLPQDRRQHSDPEFGFTEPEQVKEGKCTLKQALNFISLHNTDPIKNSTKVIAKEYKLDEEIVKNILTYFRALDLYIPKKDATQESDQDVLRKLSSKSNVFLQDKSDK